MCLATNEISKGLGHVVGNNERIHYHIRKHGSGIAIQVCFTGMVLRGKNSPPIWGFQKKLLEKDKNAL